jgi:hypothetical protein
MNSFKYCTFNALDGTDDETLEKYNNQNKNVSSTRKCEEDEDTICGDGHSTDNEDTQSDSDCK